MSRTKNTARNTIVGIACTGISYVLSFVLQAIFIRLMGLEYSGVNSLFLGILKILNIADLGFNNAILFKLYKTIADGDDKKTEMYLSTYRKICYTVGTFVAIVGLCCIPFLNSFVSEKPSFSEPLWTIYLFVLGSSVASHFINYRNILLIAKQDRYIATIIDYISIFFKHAMQIVVLLVYKNIYLYLAIDIISVLLRGLLYGIVSNKKYHLSWHSDKKITKEETKDLTKDVGALAVFKFCRTINATLDTLMISKFIAVAQTAIYGSTVILTDGLISLIDTFNDGIIASIGDLNATGDKDGVENTLKSSVHIMYLLYGICSAVLVPFMKEFMDWWIGYSLSNACIYVLIFNFYTGGINQHISTYRNSMGLYRKGWKRPMATVVVNFVASYILIQKIGILGAFLGTTIANITTMLWYDPYIVYKFGLNRSSKGFFGRYMVYLLFVFAASGLNYFIGTILPTADNIVLLVVHGIIYTACAALVLLLGGSFFKAQKDVIKRLLGLLKKKKG